MTTPTETSDAQILELLRQRGALSVSDVSLASEVTATAVRQRLNRLMAQGLIEREVAREGRGRPSHRYSLTEKARRQIGSNFADLAIVLWEEIRNIQEPEIRRGLLQRLASTMAKLYSGKVGGTSIATRMESIRDLFSERRVPLAVESLGGKSRLTIVECPYTGLAEKDRGICALESMLFSELLEAPVRLSECRLDGHACCRFETN